MQTFEEWHIEQYGTDPAYFSEDESTQLERKAFEAGKLAALNEQSGEAVAHVKRLVNCAIIDSTGCKTTWEDLPDGTPLYTRPQPAPAVPEVMREGCYCGHDSDCAIHNMPAYPPSPCDCGRHSIAEKCAWLCENITKVDGMFDATPIGCAEAIRAMLAAAPQPKEQDNQIIYYAELLYALANRLDNPEFNNYKVGDCQEYIRQCADKL